MDNRLFILPASAIVVVVLVFILSRGIGFMLELFAVMKHPGGESRIMTHGAPIPGAYTILAVREFYDGLYQGIKILVESGDNQRAAFWTCYGPIISPEASPAFQFFDTLMPGDRISIFVDEDGIIRSTLYYG